MDGVNDGGGPIGGASLFPGPGNILPLPGKPKGGGPGGN
ncbi:hypothetical protein CLG_B1829 [Clostridium botulinum D str. 1873]|uniref:Uncharacterized protein n=1 Tax=Clostridium botulinum D str. 1873 TaxID=592027 RepID=A0A9P2LKW6_CLOBO|nr:hypothetical protein CLG_B1829 [Clostridium botulinum D str. 1873]